MESLWLPERLRAPVLSPAIAGIHHIYTDNLKYSSITSYHIYVSGKLSVLLPVDMTHTECRRRLLESQRRQHFFRPPLSFEVIIYNVQHYTLYGLYLAL